MKKKSLMLLASLLLVLVSAKAQETTKAEAKAAEKKEKAAAKKQRQAIQQAENQIAFDNAVDAIDSLNFVLEADKITFLNGQFVYVNSSTNFISVNKDRGTVQLSFNIPSPGPNGMGGVTVDGMVSNIQKNVDKKGNISFSMSILGSGVSAQVFFNMFEGSNQCSATVSPNFSGNQITFTGTLYPASQSNVFKGTPLY